MGAFGLLPEVEHYLLRGVQAAQFVLRDAMKPGINLPDQRVLVGNKLGEPDDGRSCGMKRHGKEHVVALHAPKARHCIANGEGAGVTGMQISV